MEISAVRQVANSIRRETGSIPQETRDSIANMLLTMAAALEAVPKLNQELATLRDVVDQLKTLMQPDKSVTPHSIESQ
jgi:hypothetical protein